MAKFLLEAGADPNTAAKNDFKVAPIHSSCAISNLEITALLIKSGADVNVRQAGGITPLHSAAHNGNTELITLLLDSGGDANQRTDAGLSPLDMALEKNFSAAAVLLQ